VTDVRTSAARSRSGYNVTATVQTTAFVLFLPIAYVLSAPPAFWVLREAGFSIFDGAPRNWVFVPWVPLFWLEQNVPLFKTWYGWYWDFWFSALP
jgi:hypothetical protein